MQSNRDTEASPANPEHPVRSLRPRMERAESDLLRKIATGKRFAIEYGVGGSTAVILRAGIERVESIESDPAWIERLAADPEIQPHLQSGRLHMSHIDIGPTVELGYPADASRSESWPDYWRTPWELTGGQEVDLVLVDGRFRVACALEALLRGGETIDIAFHDFTTRRRYKVMLHYTRIIEQAESLVILRPKPGLEQEILEAEQFAYADDPR